MVFEIETIDLERFIKFTILIIVTAFILNYVMKIFKTTQTPVLIGFTIGASTSVMAHYKDRIQEFLNSYIKQT